MTLSSSSPTWRYFIESKTRKYVNGYQLLSFSRNLSKNFKKQLLDIAAKTGRGVLKTFSKKEVHKAAGAKDEFIENKIAWQNCETKTCLWWESKRCWRNSYSTWKKRRNAKRIKTSIIKMEHHEISKLLNDTVVSKFVTRK